MVLILDGLKSGPLLFFWNHLSWDLEKKMCDSGFLILPFWCQAKRFFSSKNKQQKNPLRELAKSHKNMVLEVFLQKDAYWSAQFITAYICDYWIKYISQNSSNMLNCGCCCYSNHKVQSYREQSVMTSVSYIMLLFDLFRQYHRPLPNGYSIVITWALVQGELHCCIGHLKNSINVEVLQM